MFPSKYHRDALRQLWSATVWEKAQVWSNLIRLEPVPAYKHLDYRKGTNMPLDRIGFCDSCCCENVKKRCWFTCSCSLKIELNSELCLHPAGHPELTSEEMEKPRLLEGMINLSALDYSLKEYGLQRKASITRLTLELKVWWDRFHPLSELLSD